MIQGSEDWFSARLGKFTGSRFADLMAATRSGPSASRANLLVAVALERITGEPEATYQNDAMRRGTELEPLARGAYEAATGELVDQVAFVQHPALPFVGVSPDGLVGADGLVEFKCPASQAKHMSYLLKGAHAIEYRWQIHGQLWVTGRQWCDVVSFDPRFPDGLQLAIKRVFRDETAIKELESACIAADVEVTTIINDLNSLKEAA